MFVSFTGNVNCVPSLTAERLLKNLLSLSHAPAVDIIISDTFSDIEHGSGITDGISDSLLMALFLRRLGKHVNCFMERNKLATAEKVLQEMGDAGNYQLSLYAPICFLSPTLQRRIQYTWLNFRSKHLLRDDSLLDEGILLP